MTKEEYDVIIIGGGITGAGTARDCALRGLSVLLIERGDTVTENAIMAASLYPGKTTIVGASPNYMVQDVCFFLEAFLKSYKGDVEVVYEYWFYRP